MCLTTSSHTPPRTHSIDQKRLLSYNPKEFSVNDPVNDMRLGSFCGHAPKELKVIKTSFWQYLKGEFPSPRSWNLVYILFHVLVSIGVLGIALFVYATWLTTGESLKALGGSVIILVCLLVVSYPLLREVVIAHTKYVVYKDDLDLGIYSARLELLQPLVQSCLKALGEGKVPKTQLLTLMRIALVSNYPLSALQYEFSRISRPTGVDTMPEFLVDNPTNPTLLMCRYKTRGAVASDRLIVYLDGTRPG